MAETVLDIVINAEDNASGKLGAITDKAKGMDIVGKAIAAGGIGLITTGLVKLGQAAVDASLEFDEATDNIMTQTGATGAELESLQQNVMDISGTLPALGQGWDDIGQVVGAANVQLGLSGEQLTQVSSDMLTFARLTGTDAVQSVEDVNRVLQGFNEETAKAPGLLDAVFTAQQEWGTNAGEMLTTLDTNAAVFQTWGMNLPTAIDLLGQLQASGVESDKAITGLRTAATKLSEEGIPPTTEALRTLFEQIKQTGGADGAAGLNMAVEYFGAKAGPELYQAIMDGKVTLDMLNADLGTAATNLNAVAGAAADAEDEYAVAMQGMRESMVGLGDSLRELAAELIPGVKAAIDDVLVPAFTEAAAVIQGIKDLVSGDRSLAEIQAQSYTDLNNSLNTGGSSYNLPALAPNLPPAAVDAYNRAMNGGPVTVNIYGNATTQDVQNGLNQALQGQGIR